MKTAIVIGAGPAGLTAAFELLAHTDIIPIIIETDKQVGGLSRTIDYKGNKIDIGGHRFFSKSERVINWWLQFLPLEQNDPSNPIVIQYHQQQSQLKLPPPVEVKGNKAMMVRPRKSRVYYQRKLFDYPLQLNLQTIGKLGPLKTMRTGLSYLYSKTFPRKPETTLEDFFINRFGKELYETFFRDYTEKVWGVPCNKLPASWGQQRVKNLDVGKLIGHAIKSVFRKDKSLNQKGTSTSLIEQFLYPRLGPGQMWETVADEIIKRGGIIHLNSSVVTLQGNEKNLLNSVVVRNNLTNESKTLSGDYFFSTMPIREMIQHSTGLPIPKSVIEVADTLEYRDFLIVGILTDALSLTEKDGKAITDNWIYVQDKGIKAGRLQFFHNWSPFMIAAPGTKWIGVEYFCNEEDPFWSLPDTQISTQAIQEMQQIGILQEANVKDTVVIRVSKAYPSYYGGYKEFKVVQDYLNTVINLFPIGRNGMHRYNNSDHSMLTAMTAVDNIIEKRTDKSNIWEINTEDEYHEEQHSNDAS